MYWIEIASSNSDELTQQRIAIITSAAKYIGPNYLYRNREESASFKNSKGETINRLDCSGLVRQMYSDAGISLLDGKSSSGMYDLMVEKNWYIPKDELKSDSLQPGDLVFWEKNGKISHVAIYLCTTTDEKGKEQRWIIESTGSENGPNISKEWNWTEKNYVVVGYATPYREQK